MLLKHKQEIKNTKIIKVDSMNLKYKNDYSNKIINENYKELLNSLQIPIRILCKSNECGYLKIKDKELMRYLNNEISNNKLINKNIYIVLQHKNKVILNSNMEIIKRYLKNMNIYHEDVEESLLYNKFNNNLIQEVNVKYIKYNNLYIKNLWINDWPYSGKLGWIDFLYNINDNIDIDCYINPCDNKWSLKFLKNKLLQYNVDTDLELEKNDDETIYLPQINGVKRILNEIRDNKGKFFTMSFYITIKANSLQEMNNKYFYLKNLLSSKGINAYSGDFKHQYYLFDKMKLLRKEYNFSTESLSTYIPFLCYNINDKNGIYIGKNISNNNLIFLDIFKRKYAVILILGNLGSGKSFLSKNILKNLSDNNVKITVFDKIGEYKFLENDSDDVVVHSNKTNKEYLDILMNYIKTSENEYRKDAINPKILLVDEILNYISDDKLGEQFSKLFNKIILEGRKQYSAFCAITQNIEHLLKDRNVGDGLIKNSNIRFIMNVNLNEAKVIAEEFDLNDNQINFLVTANEEGLMMLNSNCVKFKVDVPESRKQLFNTDPYKLEKEIMA